MRSALIAVMLFFVLAMPAPLLADSLVMPNQWYEFSFTSVGVQAQGCYPADMSPTALNCLPSSAKNSIFAPTPAWDFMVQANSATLIVTDAFLYGDSFDVYDGGVLIFSTPEVAVTGMGCGDNPVVCLADPNSSHASFVLGSGLQPITIKVDAISDAGAAYFELVETTVATPEPNESVPLLLITAFAFCLPSVRKRLQSI
jgi:hypothetical protein